MKRFIVGIVGLVICHSGLAAAFGETLYGPTAYLSFDDSPFSAIDFSAGYFFLEDCEDGLFNEPGVIAHRGVIIDRGITNDSVDADDGVIDGLGRTLAYWSDYGVKELTFTFDAGVLGGLPTHVGIVWTDVGWSDPIIGYGDVVFEAYDGLDGSLGVIGPVRLGDGEHTGETAEDRFFGVFHEGGIGSFTIAMPNPDSRLNWEVDHLQYGMVPEPTTFLLLSMGAVGLLAYALRKRR